MSSPSQTGTKTRALYSDKTNSIEDICRTLRISRATLYRYVKAGA